MTERHFYRARLVKGGPFIGVMTFFGGPLVDGEELDRSPRWQAVVRTEKNARAVIQGDAVPVELEDMTLRNIEAVSEADYRRLVESPALADPFSPEAAPYAAVDIRHMPSIF